MKPKFPVAMLGDDGPLATTLYIDVQSGEAHLAVFRGSESVVHFAFNENQSRQLAGAFEAAADAIANGKNSEGN